MHSDLLAVVVTSPLRYNTILCGHVFIMLWGTRLFVGQNVHAAITACQGDKGVY